MKRRRRSSKRDTDLLVIWSFETSTRRWSAMSRSSCTYGQRHPSGCVARRERVAVCPPRHGSRARQTKEPHPRNALGGRGGRADESRTAVQKRDRPAKVVVRMGGVSSTPRGAEPHPICPPAEPLCKAVDYLVDRPQAAVRRGVRRRRSSGCPHGDRRGAPVRTHATACRHRAHDRQHAAPSSPPQALLPRSYAGADPVQS